MINSFPALVRIIPLIALCYLFGILTACSTTAPPLSAVSPSVPNSMPVENVAKLVLAALVSENSHTLAEFAHPNKGVRFSPIAHINIKDDVVFNKLQIQKLWENKQTYTWGHDEGTGDPIVMTPKQYCQHYISERDFLNKSTVKINGSQAKSNTINNIAEVYSGAISVEYYIQPSIKDGVLQIDWAALRLVFEKIGQNWYLLAVINDQWSP
jgi:hypothetical protein